MLEREIFYERHPDPMWVYDLETLRFLDVNLAAETAYGYTREEFLALDMTAIRPPEDVPLFLESVKSAGKGRCEPGVWRHLKKSGEIMFAQITAHAVDWHGRKAELVSVRDLTRSVKLEQEHETLLAQESALRKVAEAAAAQFERLFSAVPGNLIVLAPGAWTVLAVSDAFLEAARINRANIVGRSLFDVLPETGDTPQAVSALQVRASLGRVLETGAPDQPGIVYYPVAITDTDPEDKGHRLWMRSTRR